MGINNIQNNDDQAALLQQWLAQQAQQDAQVAPGSSDNSTQSNSTAGS